MTGTIRTYDEAVRQRIHADLRTLVENVAAGAGARGSVTITPNYETTVNDDALAERMRPVLERAADGRIADAPLAGASEDFSFFARATPGLYAFLGVTPPDQDPAKAAPNHSPQFFVHEPALVVGARALASLAVAFLGDGAR
jgi:amidohydrolase